MMTKIEEEEPREETKFASQFTDQTMKAADVALMYFSVLYYCN